MSTTRHGDAGDVPADVPAAEDVRSSRDGEEAREALATAQRLYAEESAAWTLEKKALRAAEERARRRLEQERDELRAGLEQSREELLVALRGREDAVAELAQTRTGSAETLERHIDRLEVMTRERDALRGTLDRTRAELERRQAQEVAARREHDSTKAELASANKFVAQKLLEMSQLNERSEIAEQASRASAKALDESRGECANALVRLDEERAIRALSQLLAGNNDRQAAFDLVRRVAGATGALSDDEARRLQRVQTLFLGEASLTRAAE